MPYPNCIHIAKSLEKPTARPKLVKEYAMPTLFCRPEKTKLGKC